MSKSSNSVKVAVSLVAFAVCALLLWLPQLTAFGYWRQMLVLPIAMWAAWIFLCGARPNAALVAHEKVMQFRYQVIEKLIGDVFHPKRVAWLSMIIAVYASSETLLKNDLEIFSMHPVAHKYAKLASCVLVLVVAGGVAVRERRKERSLAGTELVLKGFVRMVAGIVQNKIRLLHEKAKTVKSAKKYDHVTDPHGQLRVILNESARFLASTFNLADDQIDLSVLEKCGGSPWQFFMMHQQKWNHGNPGEFFSGKPASCAFTAITTGEDVFHPSKLLAEANEEYQSSARDGGDDGSIFCSPLSVECQGEVWQFVVSIVTYGKNLCDPYDKDNEDKVRALLKEITRRVELELMHRVIKVV